MEPLVSVIVPVYNVLPYLREALDSVINQTYKNLEILIVDDGSTDGSGEVCDEYLSDPRVTVIHQENKGLSGARNAALDRMTGEYVAFLDSDDAFQPNVIEKMLNAMVHNQADMAVCGYTYCYSKLNMKTPGIHKVTQLIFDQEMILSSSNILSMIATGKLNSVVWNKLYKKSVWNSIRFPEGQNYEDLQVICQVIDPCEKVVLVPGVYILYRRRAGSITLTPTEKNVQDHMIAYNMIEKYIRIKTPGVYPEKVIHILQERYSCMFSIYYAQLLFRPHSSDTLAKIRNYTIHRWRALEGVPCQFQSRIVRFLFLHAPLLLLPARSCWQVGKQLLGKAHA